MKKKANPLSDPDIMDAIPKKKTVWDKFHTGFTWAFSTFIAMMLIVALFCGLLSIALWSFEWMTNTGLLMAVRIAGIIAVLSGIIKTTKNR